MQNTIKELTDFSKGNKDNFGITVQYNSVSPLFCILRKSGFISQNQGDLVTIWGGNKNKWALETPKW